MCGEAGSSCSGMLHHILLLLSKYPDMSNVEVKLRLRESSIDIGRPQNEQGWGLLNVEKLLKE